MLIHPTHPSPLHTPFAEVAQVERVVQFFQSLQPDSIARLGDYYVQDAYFKDPFNEVHDLSEIVRIFDHMFVALDAPHFIVTERVVQGGQCFLVWDFKFRFKRFDTTAQQVVRGTSHLRFAADGRICYHRDYWDAAEELYEKLPVLGGLMRWLKHRANT
ncbi:MAG: nuclear transport factor 2 family protein [Burkholderiaceae bacterium]